VPLLWNLGTLTSWNPLGHSRPVTGLLYLYCICTLDVLVLYVPDDGDLSPQNVKRFHVYGWFMIIYIKLCAFAGVYGWLYGWTEPRPHDNKRQACSSYSFSGSFFCIYFPFDHAASVIGKRENYRTSTLTSQQQCRRRCVTLKLIACRFVALSFCTSTQYSSPFPFPKSHRWHWNTL